MVDSVENTFRNVGGDVWAPHRDIDSPTKMFLDGIRINNRRIRIMATWEIVNQLWLDGWYVQHREDNVDTGTATTDSSYGMHLRFQI